MGLLGHAIKETEFLNNGEPMNAMMRANILEMVETFANQGHSGFSASYAIAHLIPLLKQKPVGPLTGADDEWGEPFDDKGTRQNKRCGSVFKNADGSAYDIDQVVFIDRRNGCTYTCRDSIIMSVVKFPYTPFRREIKEPLTKYWRQRLVDALGSIESVLVKEKRPQFASVAIAENAVDPDICCGDDCRGSGSECGRDGCQ